MILAGQAGLIVSPNGFGRGLAKPHIEPHRIKMPFEMHPTVMLVGAPAPIDLRETGLIAKVKDQDGQGSCIGHSGSGATESQCALDGAPLGFIPSEDIGYKGARSVERARLYPNTFLQHPLEDVGAQTEDYILWISRFGVAPRWRPTTPDGRNSDCAADTVNDNIDLAQNEAAAMLLAPGAYAINPMASNAETLVQAALSAKIVVRVDSFVDMVFEDWTKSKPPVPAPNENDPQGGGHAIYIVGWGRIGSTVYYIIRNSWAEDWGDQGDVIVSSAWIKASWGLYPWTIKRVTLN